MQTLTVPTAEAMETVGKKLAAQCRGGEVIFLQGPLGAGKTTLCRGFLRALGYQGVVKSPTYTLVESYGLPKLAVHHFDLYRLKDPAELDFIGFADYLTPHSICLIEWPEMAEGHLPTPTHLLKVIMAGDGARVLQHFCNSTKFI